MYRHFQLTENFILAVVFCLIFCGPIRADVEKPVNPLIYADGSGDIVLFWFYPGLNANICGNIISNPERGTAPSFEDRQYCLLTKFDLNPPCLIRNVSTFIMNKDEFPDLPGDQFTPLRFALKSRMADRTFADLWYAFEGLGSNPDNPGETVNVRADYCLESDFDLWLAIEWLEGTPTAPFVGVNILPPYLEQYFCATDDSSFQLVSIPSSLMVGMETWNWCKSRQLEADENTENESVQFEIYFTPDTLEYLTDMELLAAIDSDSLQARLSAPDDGFLAIKATDGGEEIFSDFLPVDKQKIAPLIIVPDIYQVACEGIDLLPDEICIVNTGSEALALTAHYDTTIIALSKTAVQIMPGESIYLDVSLKINPEANSAVATAVYFTFESGYYPVYYPLRFVGESVTSSDEIYENQPLSYFIGDPYPNPFNSDVNFKIMAGPDYEIVADVCNILGRRIYHCEITQTDVWTFSWNDFESAARRPGSGVYFFKFTGPHWTIIKKVLLLK